MSEYQGDLRVATTEEPIGRPPDACPAQREPGDRPGRARGRLAQVGRSTGSARASASTPSASSARAATSSPSARPTRCTPLDLSDPAHPAVRGELKIPGSRPTCTRSTRTPLIGVGQDGRRPGARAGHAGVAVRRLRPRGAAPHRAATLDTDWSEAESDHHAFLWWPATACSCCRCSPTATPAPVVPRRGGPRRDPRDRHHPDRPRAPPGRPRHVVVPGAPRRWWWATRSTRSPTPGCWAARWTPSPRRGWAAFR